MRIIVINIKCIQLKNYIVSHLLIADIRTLGNKDKESMEIKLFVFIYRKVPLNLLSYK